MEHFQNKKIKTLCLLLAACCLLLAACKEERSKGESEKEISLANYDVPRQYTQGIRTAVARTVITQNLDVKSLGKIDFSYPVEGPGNQFQVFSKAGGSTPNITGSNHWRELYTSDPRLIFSKGNRIEGASTKRTDLVVIIPGIYPEICEAIYSKDENLKGLKIPEIASGLNLTPHPKEVSESEVVELKTPYGCVKTSGQYYFYNTLFKR